MKEEIAVAIGKNVAEIRKERHLTQAALSELLELTPSYISRVERGKKCISIQVVLRMSDVLGISCDRIMKGQSKEAQSEILSGLTKSCSARRLHEIAEIVSVMIKYDEENEHAEA